MTNGFYHADRIKIQQYIQDKCGALVEGAHFHNWQDIATWMQLFNRAESKHSDKYRVVAIDQAAEDRVKATASQCPSLGGNINQMEVRGLDSLPCKYCRILIRL